MSSPRSASDRNTIVVGVVLVLVGGMLLVGRALSVDVLAVGWPLLVVAVGAALFAVGVATGGQAGLGLAIPGGIVSMAGFVLAFQAATGLWATWAYAWALVAPGGVGLAMVLYGALTAQSKISRDGVPVLLTGVGLFLSFGFFFEGVLHISGFAFSLSEPLFAAGLVVLGLAIVVVALFGRRGNQSTDSTR